MFGRNVESPSQLSLRIFWGTHLACVGLLARAVRQPHEANQSLYWRRVQRPHLHVRELRRIAPLLRPTRQPDCEQAARSRSCPDPAPLRSNRHAALRRSQRAVLAVRHGRGVANGRPAGRRAEAAPRWTMVTARLLVAEDFQTRRSGLAVCGAEVAADAPVGRAPPVKRALTPHTCMKAPTTGAAASSAHEARRSIRSVRTAHRPLAARGGHAYYVLLRGGTRTAELARMGQLRRVRAAQPATSDLHCNRLLLKQ
eukprot:190899-Chlamydomonas_euryale.AAC.3